MSRLAALYRSSLGKKAIVAVTGLIMFGFLVMHVVGNLKAFLPEASPGVADIDVYARFLRVMGEPLLPGGMVLWTVRTVLGVSLVLHIVCVLQLAAHNRRSRPVRYAVSEAARRNLPARSMLYTGSLILFFLGVHLLQFTTGTIDSARFTQGAVYSNLYRAFQLWYYVLLYLVAMACVALHLYHGAWSLFQSLGIDNPDRNRALRAFAVVASLGLFVAFASVPIAFFSGVMPAPPAAGPTLTSAGLGG